MFDNCRGCCAAVVLIPILCCVLAVGAVIVVYSNAPEPPIRKDFKPSRTQAQEFENALAKSGTASGGVFTLTFRQEQISSWMSYKGNDFAEEKGYDFPFKDIQIALDDGLFTFYGKFTQSGLDVPIKVVAKPKVNSDSHLEFDITEAHFGGLTVPGRVLDSVSRQLENTLTQTIADVGSDYVLYSDTLYVDNTIFSVRGQIRP